MRKFYILLAALLVVVATASEGYAKVGSRAKQSTTTGAPVKGALLYCEEMSHNFGVVNRRDGDQKHTFIIENRGDAPLVITQVISSCSCMKSSVSQRPIMPNEKRELKLTYEIKKMPIGTFSKSVVLHTTSRDAKPARFTLSGRSSYVPRREN